MGSRVREAIEECESVAQSSVFLYAVKGSSWRGLPRRQEDDSVRLKLVRSSLSVMRACANEAGSPIWSPR